ncbi:hypothetical protein BDB01DRAFT_854570 [Pilobolus umbonatus]|nr:hypothetical protein BDB01DRAFT_854570 [Pilobolus umbonatus]
MDTLYPEPSISNSQLYITTNKQGEYVSTERSILKADPQSDPKGLTIKIGKARNYGEYLRASQGVWMIGTAIKFPDKTLSNNYIFDDAVIEYRSYAGVKKAYNKFGRIFKGVYLGTWACIGIPVARYKWCVDQIARNKIKLSKENVLEKNGYCWILSKMDETGVFVHVADHDQKLVGNLGSLLETMSCVRRSLSVVMECAIRLLLNDETNVLQLSFLLKNVTLKGTSTRTSPYA